MEELEAKEDFISKYKYHNKHSILERLYESICLIREQKLIIESNKIVCESLRKTIREIINETNPNKPL